MATTTRQGGSSIEFARKLVHASTRQLDFNVSDDGKAFDIKFVRTPAAGVGTPQFDGVKPGKAPIGTTVFSAVVGARGAAAKATLALNGFLLAEAGTSVMVVAIVNDRLVSQRFRNVPDGRDFVMTVPLPARALSELRVVVWLLAQREAGSTGSALIALNDVGCDSFKPRRAGRATPQR